MATVTSPTAQPPVGIARVYDDFAGASLHPDRWVPLSMPLPDGTVRICTEPSARTVIEDGALTVTVERIETSHDHIQPADNAKHLLLSTEQFALPERGRITFSVEQVATRLNAEPTDHRLGMVCFNVLDQATGLVFDIAGDGRAVFAVHEQLAVPDAPQNPFTHLVESPFAPVDLAPGSSHRLAISIDTREREVVWTVDDQTISSITGPLLPERVQLGLGLLSCVRLRGQGTGSIRGQGISGRWARPAVTVHP